LDAVELPLFEKSSTRMPWNCPYLKNHPLGLSSYINSYYHTDKKELSGFSESRHPLIHSKNIQLA
jgi:hypothetical protein